MPRQNPQVTVDGRLRVAAGFGSRKARRPSASLPHSLGWTSANGLRRERWDPWDAPCRAFAGGVAGWPAPSSRACLTNGTRKQQSGRRKQTSK